MQSVATAQLRLLAHGLQVPPQSTSVSLPFFTPSVQPGVWQIPDLQNVLAQSPSPEHFLPTAHLGHVLPQSMSVSVPF